VLQRNKSDNLFPVAIRPEETHIEVSSIPHQGFSSTKRWHSLRRIFGILLLLAALAQFGVRGLERVRSEVPLWDFASVFAASRAWIHRQNPYDLPVVLTTWHQAGIYSDRDVSYFATVYPPNSLAMLIPFALLPATIAMWAWLALTLALVVLQFAALADLAGLPLRDPRTLILFAASLASAPFQFAILSGQLSMPAISLGIIAVWCAARDRRLLAGVILGLACAIKPQIGAPFVAYYLLSRRWSVAGIAILISGIIAGGALIAMHLAHIDWYTGWKQSIALTTRIGGVNDYGWAGDFRDEIMDLKMLLVSLVHDPRMLRIAVEAISAILAIWYLRVFRSKSLQGRDQLLMLAGLAAVSLLPIYHRVYDAALLTTALAWALAELDGPRRRISIVLLIPMAVFLIPYDFTATLGHHLHRLADLAAKSWWQTWIAPHYAWGLLLLTIAILVAMGRIISRSAMPSDGIFQAPRRSPTTQGS
jgi:hypothetical protein